MNNIKGVIYFKGDQNIPENSYVEIGVYDCSIGHATVDHLGNQIIKDLTSFPIRYDFKYRNVPLENGVERKSFLYCIIRSVFEFKATYSANDISIVTKENTLKNTMDIFVEKK